MSAAEEGPSPAPTDGFGIAALRLAVGLCGGLFASLISQNSVGWDNSHPGTYATLRLLDASVSLVLLAGIGHLRRGTLVVWVAAVALTVAALTRYAVWRGVPAHAFTDGALRSLLLGAILLYVAHHLIEPADVEWRWPPLYAALVDAAWRHAFQMPLALLFVGVLWLVLFLGGELFDLIGIDVVRRIIWEPWFHWPALGLAFAGAVHLTDVRPGLIAGLRMVVLMLLSWLLVPAVFILSAFLAALPATGLQPLWATERSTGLLLSVALLVVVLVNAAFGDGRRGNERPAVVRWSGRVGAVLLTPLAGLSAWGIAQRIGQHGLTPSRVYATAAVGTAAVYAAGYLWAAAGRGPWMQRLGRVNVIAAIALVGEILAILSPALDPGRLSAEDQERRLGSSNAAADGDLEALRFDMGRFGLAALRRLAESQNPLLAERSRQVLAADGRGRLRRIEPPKPGPAFARARVVPEGTALPEGFRDQVWTRADPACLSDDTPCDILLIPHGHETLVAVLAAGRTMQAFSRGPNGSWVNQGSFDSSACGSAGRSLEPADLHPAAPVFPDLATNRLHLTFTPSARCSPVETR